MVAPAHRTVMFLDMRGSTRLYEAIGDVAAEHTLRRAVDLCARQIHMARGAVVKGTGDGLLAVFNDAAGAPSLGDLRLLLFECGRQGARDAIRLTQVDCGAAPEDERFFHAWRFVSDTPQPHLPFSGADIVARGVGPGQRVGAVLKNLQALWIPRGLPALVETLARLMEEALKD